MKTQEKDEGDEDSMKSSNETQKTVKETVVKNAGNRLMVEREESFLREIFCRVTLLGVKCENELTLHSLYSNAQPVAYCL